MAWFDRAANDIIFPVLRDWCGFPHLASPPSANAQDRLRERDYFCFAKNKKTFLTEPKARCVKSLSLWERLGEGDNTSCQ